MINVILTITGVILGWVYLRFYQQKGKGAKGDLRDGFAFATFFPEPLQYVCFSTCVMMNLNINTSLLCAHESSKNEVHNGSQK